MAWLQRAAIIVAWLCFILIFADARLAEFDITPWLLDVLAGVGVAGMLTMVLTIRR